MNYTISTTMLPAGAAAYIKGANTNPTTIETGATVTLKFIADGVYYTLLKAATSVVVTGATVVSWTCVKPFLEGTLIISNPTDNVSVSVTGKVAVQRLDFAQVFNIKVKAPIDTRTVLTKAQMVSINENYQPDCYYALCPDDCKIYIYDKNLVANSETGKFRPIDDFIDEQQIISRGYYLNGEFYTDSTYTVIIPHNNQMLYVDLNTYNTYMYYGEPVGYKEVINIPAATSEVKGLVKLYNTHGQNTDGTMTQKAITDGVNAIKFAVEQTPDEDGDGEPENILVLDLPWD